MKFFRQIKPLLFLGVLLFNCACRKKEVANPFPGFTSAKPVPQEIVVKTKSSYGIKEVFDFINDTNQEIDYLRPPVMTSALPADSLQYILNYLNAKTYTNDDIWRVGGYLHYQTRAVTIITPRLYHIMDNPTQKDWLDAMKHLKLKENTGEIDGSLIYFRVPAGNEEQWLRKFLRQDIVDWAEQNSYTKFTH